MQPATTKREVLAATMSIFHSLGWLTSSTIVIKIFFLELWEKGREWDGKMLHEEIKRWKKIIGGLEYTTDIHISRFVGNNPAQFLRFCDASNRVCNSNLSQEHHQWHCQFTVLKRTKCTKKGNTYRTKTETFLSINWCKKPSVCHKGTENWSNRKKFSGEILSVSYSESKDEAINRNL